MQSVTLLQSEQRALLNLMRTAARHSKINNIICIFPNAALDSMVGICNEELRQKLANDCVLLLGLLV